MVAPAGRPPTAMKAVGPGTVLSDGSCWTRTPVPQPHCHLHHHRPYPHAPHCHRPFALPGLDTFCLLPPHPRTPQETTRFHAALNAHAAPLRARLPPPPHGWALLRWTWDNTADFGWTPTVYSHMVAFGACLATPHHCCSTTSTHTPHYHPHHTRYAPTFPLPPHDTPRTQDILPGSLIATRTTHFALAIGSVGTDATQHHPRHCCPSLLWTRLPAVTHLPTPHCLPLHWDHVARVAGTTAPPHLQFHLGYGPHKPDGTTRTALHQIERTTAVADCTTHHPPGRASPRTLGYAFMDGLPRACLRRTHPTVTHYRRAIIYTWDERLRW